MKLKLIVILIPVVFQIHSVTAQGSDCCDRHAIHQICSSSDPMNIIGSNDTYCRSISSRLTELMTKDCFHFLNAAVVDAYRERANEEGWGSLVKPSNVPEHEYSFDTDFESGLDEYREDGRPVRSRLTVEMYFEGEQRELVHTWKTQGTWDTVSNTGTTWYGHGNKLKSAYRYGPDILEIIERFEKRPVDFNINPERDEFDAGEVVEFDLTDFKDIFDETSREFNRIVVHAYEGDILNGDPCNIGPEYRVFKLNEGSVKVKYRAPSDCNISSDRFTVYSSCDILPDSRAPIVETEIKERIFEKEYKITCFDAKIKVSKNLTRVLQTSRQDSKREHVESRKINATMNASANIYLKLTNTMDMPILNQTWYYYQPVQVSINSFNNLYNENRHITDPEYVTNIDIVRINKTQKIEGEEYISQFPPWMLVIDNETKKAVKLIPAGYGIEYEFIETENSTTTSSSGKDSHSETRQRKLSFELGPVGEKGPDPTVKKSDTWIQDYLKRQGIELPPGAPIPNISNEDVVQEVQPDVLVKYGDGISSFGGGADRLIDKKLEDGFDRTNLNYSWNMTIRNKKIF